MTLYRLKKPRLPCTLHKPLYSSKLAMAAITPRRSTRIPHIHTPKMSEIKKGLFVREEALTMHRKLPVVDSESDNDDCDLGIICALDTSSCDENDLTNTPERNAKHVIKGNTMKIKETKDLKNFMKSPFTLKKYQNRYCPEPRCSSSTPATPHFQHHPGTPSSTHSCASAHTTSSTPSRARKSLASLIAETESCSSSLKDLNFDTDSSSDSKENTPTKSLRCSTRRQNSAHKYQSFKGILSEHNTSPMKTAVVCLTKIDFNNLMSPTHMLKTPHSTTVVKASPPKIGQSRRSAIEITESPESICDSEKSHKRLHYDDKNESGPISKYPRLDPTTAPKARLSLFNSERLKEILSAKSFYGKSNPELNTNITNKFSHAIQASNVHKNRVSHSHRRKRRPGQINMGVRHKIKKPKINRSKTVGVKRSLNNSLNQSQTSFSTQADKNDSLISQNTSQEMEQDPFGKEKLTVEALLLQWTEDEEPEIEVQKRPDVPCFDKAVIDETSSIFQPITAVPVQSSLPLESDTVIVEIGTAKSPNLTEVTQSNSNDGETPQVPFTPKAEEVMDIEGHVDSHGELPKGDFLPVHGGYIVVDGTVVHGQTEIPDLDEIERELRMLDEQILKMAESNNINGEAVIASTESVPLPETSAVTSESSPDKGKLFPIFSKPNPGLTTPTSKDSVDKCKKKILLKSGHDQYQIDAGQKKFGATECGECGVIYHIGDPEDEHAHFIHHNATDVLKFTGLKDEYIVDKSGTARCIRVRGGDNGWRRVETLLDRAYLYIEKKEIIGCLIMEPKTKANKLLPGSPDCCSVETYPVKCGVSRIWTHPSYRGRGVASRMLDCARASFLYGAAVSRQHVAMSAPTPAGKALA
ncbi:unnamed protein product, partial [Leptidea sinapis]